MNRREWSIQELAKAAGTTSRTLRYYGDLGLLLASRTGSNGMRYYAEGALIRLQRILLLRELGLSLPVIAEVLAGERDTAAALETHLDLLRQEQERISRQIASVETTLRKTREGEPLMPNEVFDGFDFNQYRDEVIERWGKENFELSANWWRNLSEPDRQRFLQRQTDLAQAYADACSRGLSPEGPEAREITRQHYEWVTIAWQGRRPTAEEFAGLGQMYVDDPRFTAPYDGKVKGTAAFVREAMRAFAEQDL